MNNQELAIAKLSKLKVGALFMEMGTGKTKVALDLISSKKHKVNYILWLCPFSIKQEIEAERLKWQPTLEIDIVGVETVSQSDRTYLKLLERVRQHKTFIVVDESLKIKNRNAKRTQRIIKLGEYAEYKLILNGTPLSKNVLDLYTQMEFLSPKILNMSFNQFKNQYCEYYISGRLKNQVKKQYNIEHLISLIKPYIYDAALDLGKQKQYISIDYEIADINEYENIKEHFLDFGDDISFFALATSLQHCYCSSNLKMKKVENIINKINGQVIIFVKYLDSIPQEVKKITGETKEEERASIIDSFKKNEFKALYITYGCGTFGLNLQCCQNIIFADHTFDYAQRIQAEARIFRMGQENNVTYYDLNCNCGLDRLIRGCLNKKVKLLDEVKQEIEKKGVKKWLKTI